MIHRAALVIERAQVLRLRVRRQFFYQPQRLRVMLLGFGVTVEFRRVIACVNQVLDCASEITSAFEVDGEVRGDLRRTFAEMTEQMFACLLMQHDATLIHEIAVQKILIERMREPKACHERAVRKFFFAQDVDQPMRLRDVRKQFFEIDLIDT